MPLAERSVGRAAVLYGWRQPFRVEEARVRVPSDWVPVRVRSVGVCGRDLVVWKGGFPNLRLPLILGHEVFGEHEGRPVGVFPAVRPEECRRAGGECGDYAVLGEHVPGGYAEIVHVPRENLAPLPDGDYDKYAAAVCGVATMIHAARVAGVGRGDRVLVTGASGGVGIHGAQYLALIGAEVYAYTRSPEKARILRELGLHAVTSLDFYRSEGRVDAVMELVGGPTINESMRTLRPGGTLVLVGNITGEPIVIRRPALLVMREISIRGSAAYTPEEWLEAIRIVAEGRVKPFYRAYPLEEVNEAYRDALEGGRIGRVILRP